MKYSNTLTNTHKLFTTIAPYYDRITRLLSCGQDTYWKKQLIDIVNQIILQQARSTRSHSLHCLDLACGTGDITYALAQQFPDASIIGLDFNQDMLNIAIKKLTSQLQTKIEFICTDMAHTTLPNHKVDLITTGYALRNAPYIDAALLEISRLLKPNGIVACLEFARPTSSFRWYMHYYTLKAWGALWGCSCIKNHLYTHI